MTKMIIDHLRCEYRKNPVGIDILKPRLSWQIKSAERDIKQAAYQLQVAKTDTFTELIFDTGKILSDQSIQVEYDGPELKSGNRYFYRVKVWDQDGNQSDWSQPGFWEMGLLETKEWIADWINPGFTRDKYEACPYLRNTFNVKKEIQSARIYVTSLGLYQLYLNGEQVGDYYFTPGWTSYHNRLQYQTYDITGELKVGKNGIGAVLADGWYKGDLMTGRNFYGDELALLLQLHINYQDGSEEIITTNQGWKTNDGPIRMSEIYHGETYDERLDINGWSQGDYNDHSWQQVEIMDYPKEHLVAQVNEPVKKIEDLDPFALIKTPDGDTVIDMGQNMVGWVKLKVEGEAGSEITLQHAEVLDTAGNFYTENLRSAKQTNTYILSGQGEESFEPHFSFQGFRYVKVEGYPGEIDLNNFKGIVLHSEMEPTGNFSCSNDLINRLQHNIIWGQKGNFVDVPTDCPQRDERLGWTGDAQVFIRTASFNMNVAPFFNKWLKDLEADQLNDGGIPAVIPGVLESAKSSSAWGDAATICPWTLYLSYGDQRILNEQYESMKAWVEYIRAQGENEYLWETGHHFGDWLALDADEDSYTGATDKAYIATAFFAYSTEILKNTALVLNKEEDVERYSDLHQKILTSFQAEFVTPNGRLAVPTQTAHVLALMFNLIKEKDRERVINTLVEYIKENDNHLTTGFVGTPYLCHVLSQNGYNELAYTLVQQTDYPSWLYQVTRGATTVWEHWNGIKEDGSFWSADMNSFNHYAYGAIGDWLYRVVAGIDTASDQPGYKKILIKPQPGPGLTSAEASLQSMYGLIKSAWKQTGDKMIVEINIPVNTTAVALLPLAGAEVVMESDKKLSHNTAGIYSYHELESGLELKLGSGSYIFKYPYQTTQGNEEA